MRLLLSWGAGRSGTGASVSARSRSAALGRRRLSGRRRRRQRAAGRRGGRRGGAIEPPTGAVRRAGLGGAPAAAVDAAPTCLQSAEYLRRRHFLIAACCSSMLAGLELWTLQSRNVQVVVPDARRRDVQLVEHLDHVLPLGGLTQQRGVERDPAGDALAKPPDDDAGVFRETEKVVWSALALQRCHAPLQPARTPARRRPPGWPTASWCPCRTPAAGPQRRTWRGEAGGRRARALRLLRQRQRKRATRRCWLVPGSARGRSHLRRCTRRRQHRRGDKHKVGLGSRQPSGEKISLCDFKALSPRVVHLRSTPKGTRNYSRPHAYLRWSGCTRLVVQA